MTIQSSVYIFILQVEELCLREGTCTCSRPHRKLDGQRARIRVGLPFSCLPGSCGVFPLVCLSVRLACLLARPLGCVDKVSNQLGVGSVRSGAGWGSAEEGAERQVRRSVMGSSHREDGGDRVTDPAHPWPSPLGCRKSLLARSVAPSSASPAGTPAKTHGSGFFCN